MSKTAKSFQEMVHRLFGMNRDSTSGRSTPWSGPRFAGRSSMPTINAETLGKATFRIEDREGQRCLAVLSADHSMSWALLNQGTDVDLFNALAAMPYYYKGTEALIGDCEYLIGMIERQALTPEEAHRVINAMQNRAFTLQRIALEGAETVGNENAAELRMKK